MDEQNTPRSNRAQNRQFDAAIREAERELNKKLTPANKRRIHDEISGQNMDFDELVEFVLSLYGEGEQDADETIEE